MTAPNINRILREDPVMASRGAPIGATNFHDSTCPLYLQRVNFVDGDYAPDGTYWGGGGDPLWCAFNGDDCQDYDAARGTRIYVRAADRKEAQQEVIEWAEGRGLSVTFKARTLS